MLAMDDGGRCLLDVIDDPKLLQSFLENTNGAIERLETGVNVNQSGDKTLNSIKQPIDSKILSNISMSAINSDISKNSDYVTSSGGNGLSLTSINNNRKIISGQTMIDEKPTINMVSSSVGYIPISSFSSAVTAASLSIAPSMTTMTNTVGHLTSTLPLRTSTPNIMPSFQIAGPRNGGPLTVQYPQQLIVQAGAVQMTQTPGLQQMFLTTPRSGAPHPALPPGIQPGQLVQIIHTPNGPQILPTNPTATVQSIVSTNSTTKLSTTSSSSRSNKQILPKPPGSTVSANNTVPTNSVNKCQQITQQNTLKVINSLPTNATQFTSTTIPTSGTMGPQTQQILIGPGGQPVIAGPNGTFLLNHMFQPNIGSQPFLIQGVPNVPNSVQLTLRPPNNPSVMTVNNGLTAPNISVSESNAGILNMFTGQTTNMSKQATTQSPQPQTIVIPNNSTSVTSAAPGMVMSNANRSAPNIIFTRQQPSIIGTPHHTQHTGQQFLQLQTPNGPVLVAIQTQPQLLTQAQTQPTSQPTHGLQFGNTMIPINAPHLSSHLTPNLTTSMQTAAHPALHALLTQTDNTSGQTVIQTSVPSVATSNTVILTSQPQIITRSQLPTSQSQQLKGSAPSLNLAELLKEHGILPESSPPSSPTNNTDLSTGALHPELIHANPPSQQTVLMVPNGPNQPPNIVLTQNPVAPTAPPQLRLALGPDGSVILQPHITANTGGLGPQLQSQFITNSNNLKFNDSSKDTSGLSSSQPSPDSTTPSIDATSSPSTTTTVSQTTTTSTLTAPTLTSQSTGTSALLDQLNTGPAVKVPDLVASLALSQGSAGTGTTNTTGDDLKPTIPSQQTALIPLTVQNLNNNLDQQKQQLLSIPVQSGDCNTQNVSNGSSNAVIRIGSCDTMPPTLVFTTTPTTVFASPPKTQTTGPTMATVVSPVCSTNSTSCSTGTITGTTATVIDQNGVPMVQVSPNNQEFLQRLESQLKNLLVLKSPTPQQKELLQELLTLKQKMNIARNQKTSPEDQKQLSTVCVSPQTSQTIQSQIDGQLLQQQQQTPQNMHLRNLLKQTPVPVNQPSATQIRLLAPASNAPVNGTTTIQLGNQIITFTTPAKQQLQNINSTLNNQTVVKPQMTTPTPVILRYHSPTATSLPTNSTLVTTSTTTKTSIIKHDTHLDKEKRNAKIVKAVQQQLTVDQNAALKPDTKRPFTSRDDACKRLLRYHVFNSPVMSTTNMEKSDHLFQLISKHLLSKKQQLYDKFRVLLMKQSMRETPSSEHVMIDRMFINDEMTSLKTDKEAVAEGKVLDLPPAPTSWYQMIRSSIEEEQKQLFINRKRKSSIGSDDEYNHHNSQIKRHDDNVEESEESEDEDDDSDEEDNEEKDDTISDFLQTQSDQSLGNVGNVGHYYDSFQHNIHVQNGLTIDSQNHVPLNTFVDPNQTHNDLDIYGDMTGDTGAQNWTDSILNNNSANRRIAWNHRFGVPESEAAVAVESILTDDVDDEPDMSVDLSGIEGLDDDNLEVDNEEEDDDEEGDDEDDDDDDDDEDDDVVDSFAMGSEVHQQHQQHVDVQMQCAIKSILDMPSVPSQTHQSHNSYPFHSHNTHGSHPSLHPHMNDYRNMDYSHIPNIHEQRRNDAMMRPYVNHTANDPILDEAVKSILS
ncbi:mucin-2-like [Oppia nitens]|uniref:mucin-2-like n=1 Tax=Oppia nitens TaxID=1686743 RepID=UPI0023D9EC48|nr:mucin-2-like [Oppia nitens]